MAALVAKRRNPTIRTFALRLAGKKPKVIIVACMRKLLTILNAVARDQAMWHNTQIVPCPHS
jgi:transposase